MRSCLAYTLLVAIAMIYSSVGQVYGPPDVKAVDPSAVLNPVGRRIGHTRKITRPGSSGGGSDPVATNPNPPVEGSVDSTTVAPTFLHTATPYLISGGADTPVTKAVENTTAATKSDMYFSPADMSLFTSSAGFKATGGATTIDGGSSPKQETTSTTESVLVAMKADANIVKDKVPLTIPSSLNTDNERKGKKPPPTDPMYFEPPVEDTKKQGTKNQADNKASVPASDAQPKMSVSAMEAKRVYDSVLKAYDSVKPGMCFSPDELQKAFPKCKIMY